MRQFLLIFALLGAVISGWVPAMAATLHAAQPSHTQTMHHGNDGSGEHGKSKPAAHPVACSACFAIESQKLEPANRLIDISARVSVTTPRLAGLALSPLDPPPRS